MDANTLVNAVSLGFGQVGKWQARSRRTASRSARPRATWYGMSDT